MREVRRTQEGMTFKPAHKPGGTPDGGQFTAPAHSDTVPSLTAPANPLRDVDGTVWEFGGDEYTDVYTSRDYGIELVVTTDIREGGARAKAVDYRGSRPLVLSDQTLYDSLDEAKEAVKEVRSSAGRHEHNRISVGSRSPWGKLQGHDLMAPGIDMTWTAGHGGIKLSPERANRVDPAWAEPAGWYEQDCSWTKAVITHFRDLPAQTVATAHKEARKFYPDEYTAIVGKNPAKYGLETFEPITAAESSIVEKREFLAGRAATHDKVQSVIRDLDGHPGMIAVVLCDIPTDGREADGAPVVNQRTVLVPEAEWSVPWTERHTVPKTDRYQELKRA